ncbi:MAG: flavin-nucleotide-binding protein, partial [bacterium]|nr:flavin-nucleotide-binding protein [bacterium]
MTEYHMNKQEREIKDQDEIYDIIEKGLYAIVSMCRENDPYIVTMNYGYDRERNSLYFHCAQKGLKLDYIKDNPRVCATVIDDRGYLMDKCSHAYRSAVFWGSMHYIEELEEKIHAMEIMLYHLEDNPDKVRARLLKKEVTYRKLGILR